MLLQFLFHCTLYLISFAVARDTIRPLRRYRWRRYLILIDSATVPSRAGVCAACGIHHAGEQETRAASDAGQDKMKRTPAALQSCAGVLVGSAVVHRGGRTLMVFR